MATVWGSFQILASRSYLFHFSMYLRRFQWSTGKEIRKGLMQLIVIVSGKSQRLCFCIRTILILSWCLWRLLNFVVRVDARTVRLALENSLNASDDHDGQTYELMPLGGASNDTCKGLRVFVWHIGVTFLVPNHTVPLGTGYLLLAVTAAHG